MAYDIGPRIGIQGEAEFRKSITAINDSYKTLKTEMNAVTSAFDKNDQSQEKLTKQNEILTKQVELQRKKVEETTAVMKKSSDEYGDADKKTLAWQRTVNAATAELNKLESQLETNNKTIALQNSGWNTLGRTLDTTGAKVTALGDGMVGAGQKMTVGITAPIIALGTASVAAFKNVDDGMDTIIKKTGATGESAEELEEIYKNLGSNAPEDLGDVGAAIGEINTRLEFTGEKLEKASTDFLKFAKVNDTDVNSAIQLVTRSMADAGIEVDEYNSVLDMLTVAAQKSGISMDSLATNLTKYGAPMRALGLDTKTSIAIFAGWEKAGVNTEIAFAGMKKAISNWAAEGKDSRVEFQNTLDAIKSAPDIAAATTMAIDVFGQKAGPDLADAIQGGRFEIDDYIEALDNAGGAVENTYEQIESSTDDAKAAFNKIEIASSELGETVLEVLTPALEETGEIIGDVADWYSDLNPEMQEAIIVTAGLAAAAGPLLVVSGSLLRAGGTMLTTIGTVSGAIGVMTTGATAATPAIGGMAAAMTALTGPVGLAILGVTAMTVGLGALYVHQKNNTVQTKEQIEMNKKFITSTDNVTDSIGKNMEARETSLKTTENEVVAAKTLAEKIFELSEKQNKSASELEALNSFVDEFNKIMPDANLLVDEHSGALNLTRDAVTDLIAVEEDRIRLAAVSDLLIQNAKDQLDVTRQLNEAQTEANRLQEAENVAVQEAIAQGGSDVQVKQRLNKVYDEYGQAITDANTSTDSLKTKQAELSAENEKLNGLVSDKAGWDAYTTNTVEATTATENYATDANAALERYRAESAVTAEETGLGIGTSTATGLNGSSATVGVATQAMRDEVTGKLGTLGKFGNETGQNVGQGLIDGQEAKKEAIGIGVGGIVGLLIEKFKVGLGINSPSIIAHGFGFNWIEGLINGMKVPDITSFVNNMVENIKSSFAAGNFNLKAAIDFVGTGAAEFFKSIGIGGSDFAGLTVPVGGGITSGFGYRDDVQGVGSSDHMGIDIGAGYGAPVGAAGAGTVTQAGWYGGYGNTVIIDHGNGLETLYGHLSQVLVNVGDLVSQLQTIGLVGSTGNSTGPHLHFGVMQNGAWVDPSSIFGYAGGTNWATPGLHWVGENGPELMNFRGGETVYTNTESKRIVNNTQAKQPLVLQLTLQNGTKIAEYLIDDINNMLGVKTGLAGRGMA
jgi:phage tail tape measure protein, TP901 family, core region